jgi:thiol-disulfide isomerase/thioredoxin
VKVLAVSVLVAALISAPPAFAQPPDRAALQSAVDRFAAVDMSGHDVSMRALHGRVVLIEFWATWCAPCLADIPWIKEAREAHGDHLEVVGVSLDVIERAALVSWLRRHDVSWRQVHDGRGWSSPLIEPFGFDGIPFNVLVSADGRVVGTNVRGEALLRSLDVLLRRPAHGGDSCQNLQEDTKEQRTHEGSRADTVYGHARRPFRPASGGG